MRLVIGLNVKQQWEVTVNTVYRNNGCHLKEFDDYPWNHFRLDHLRVDHLKVNLVEWTHDQVYFFQSWRLRAARFWLVRKFWTRSRHQADDLATPFLTRLSVNIYSEPNLFKYVSLKVLYKIMLPYFQRFLSKYA